MEYQTGAALVRRGRERRGLLQGTAANRLGVKQQTISRWETGTSRPSSDHVVKLAQLLEIDGDGLLKAFGYARTSRPPRPVRPLAPSLPLSALSPTDFEAFCAALVSLWYRGAEVHRYGSQGHKQDGIDLTARLADGTVRVFQCKRAQQFGSARVAAVVENTQVEADNYVLLLSRTASPNARKEMDRHPRWALLDDDDIARIIRTELELGDAQRLVDTYFPGARHDFLGLLEPSIWLTTEQFFGPMLRPGAVLSHRWKLVGRQDEVAAAARAATAPSTGTLFVGGGGTGKSRVLLAVARAIESESRTCAVRFLAPDRDLQARDLELLPSGPCVVVIDDGHDRPEVSDFVMEISRARGDVSFLVATRPYAVDRIEPTMLALGLTRPGESARIDLARLGVDDLTVLASQVLRDRGASTEGAEAIALATRDSPLFTVIAAELVASGQADPRKLANDETARSLLLRSFRDELFGEVGAPYDRQPLRELLDLIALVQPIDPDDIAFRGAAEHVLGVHADVIVRHVRTLENAGLLLRRGRRLRVVPDLLADFLVAESCIDPKSGSATGYADRVRAATGGTLAKNLIQNVAKLDWRVSRVRDAGSQALDQIWADLTTELLSVGVVQRSGLLRELEDISYYQPRRSIDLARALLANPTEDPGAPPQLLPHTIDYEHVIDELPQFLRGAAFHLEYLVEVADLLWELGRDSERMLYSHPGNGVRILQDLAAVERNKPLAFTERIVDRALVWLRQPEVGRFLHSPFDVLEVALATEGHTTRARGWTLSMTPFTVNVDAVRDTRRKVLIAAVEELQNSDVRVATRAAVAIENGLRYPRGSFGGVIQEEQLEPWTPEIIWLLELTAAGVTDSHLHPVVQERVRRAIRRQAKHGRSDAKVAAARVLSSLPEDPTVRLAEALTYGWAHTADLIEEDEEYDYERSEQRWREVQHQGAVDLLARERSASTTVDVLEATLTSLAEAGSQVGATPGPFLDILFDLSSEVAEEVVHRCIARSGPLRDHLHLALLRMRTTEQGRALELAQTCLEVSEPIPLAIWVAAAYGSILRDTTPTPAELMLLRELGRHPHEQVRLNVARGLRFAPALERSLRIDLIMAVDIEGSSQVADELVGNFGRHGDFTVTDLSGIQRQRFIEELLICRDIGAYQIGSFLAALAATNPLVIVDLLTRRVDRAESRREDLARFQPVPFQWDEESPVVARNAPDFDEVVRRVLEWASELEGGARASFWAPHVFAALVGPPDGQVLAIVDAWVAPGDERQLESAVHLLSQAPSAFVWDNVDWVCRALDSADAVGANCYSRVAASLYSAVVSGGRSGTPGEPFPEDVEQRDRAKEIACGLPQGSPGHRFFVSLARAAEDAIKWSIQRDEEDRPE